MRRLHWLAPALRPGAFEVERLSELGASCCSPCTGAFLSVYKIPFVPNRSVVYAEAAFRDLKDPGMLATRPQFH